jgi:hypothetical protein
MQSFFFGSGISDATSEVLIYAERMYEQRRHECIAFLDETELRVSEKDL